jgi:hypothetical protein
MAGALLEAGAPPKQRHDVVEGVIDSHLWGGGTGPSPVHLLFPILEAPGSGGSRPFLPDPGLPHLTQLPWVHGRADRAAEVPQEVTRVGESAQHTEAGRAVGVGH